MTPSPLVRHAPTTARPLVGIAVIGVGSLALLDKLHLFDLSLLWTLWPLALTLFGLARMASGRHAGHWLFGLALALAGLGLTADHLGLWHFQPRDWWPLFAIGAGVSMLKRRRFG